MPFVEQGTNVTLSAIVADSLGNPADSADLELTIQTLAGVALAGFPTSTGIVHDGLGEYHYVWACGLTQAVGTYEAAWAGTVGGADFSGVEEVEVVTAGTTSGTTLAQVKALVRSRLSDDDLQTIIDREEEWLATKIGVLSGARMDTFKPGTTNMPLYLSRRTDSVSVTDDGVAVAATDLLFTPSTGCLRRVAGVYPWPYPPPETWFPSWQGDVAVTWTPTDGAAVTRAIIELVRGTVGETGMESETIGDYQYTRGASASRVSRIGLVRGILLRHQAYSMPLRSAAEARP
jgi:hypothetical protein